MNRPSPYTAPDVAVAHLPSRLAPLLDLAFDLRWTWDSDVRQLFAAIDPDLWARAPANPWLILKTAPRERLFDLAADPAYLARLDAVRAARQRELEQPTWFEQTHAEAADLLVAYFTAEIGVAESLPLYAGGLGILAGDLLKSASDLGVPVVAVTLLYGQGFFRQQLSRDGWQIERHPVTPVEVLPLTEARRPDGTTLTVRLDFPGRPVDFLVWRATIGRVTLLLLDANLPTNAPADRDITRELYADGQELRLQQELALGVGGWRALEGAGFHPNVLHMNEGHAAFAALERAHSHALRTGLLYAEARMATAPGNLFTTHTPVEAAFDRFAPDLIARYLGRYADAAGLSLEELLAYGRIRRDDPAEPFHMAAFALRHAWAVNGVSQLHREVSRAIFRPWFPRIPDAEIPVGAVTNAVHVPSWISPEFAAILPRAEGANAAAVAQSAPIRWEAAPDLADEVLWRARAAARHALVAYVRRRVAAQEAMVEAEAPSPGALPVFDPETLTLGFARRFTAYKRPTLLLRQPERLRRLLLDPQRPVQVVVAGKAHPLDEEGKRLLQQVVAFARDPALRHRFVFLEDDDIDLMQHLVAGVDVWVNTPRRPLEASGTSGMKVLANGGLNLSVPDGWWAEAYEPEVGWAVGGGEDDAADAERLYALLEGEVVPAFYGRGPDGLPHAWLARIKASLSRLTPRFAGERMVRQYAEEHYLPARARLARVAEEDAAEALAAWERVVRSGWPHVVIREVGIERQDTRWVFRARVWMPDIPPEFVSVQLFAEGIQGAPPEVVPMRAFPAPPETCDHYVAEVAALRPAEHYTVRVVPFHPLAPWPAALPLVLWEH
jgi:starch phosphorylase